MFSRTGAHVPNSVESTYMDLLLAGEVLLQDIDDFIDDWHDAPDGSWAASQSLEEFLGMTPDEYTLWVERPESLRFIAAAHKAKQPVSAILASRDSWGLAARANEQSEAHELLQWLIDRGRIKEVPH
jgi:hypothetical protein